jgi:hypothetical protein
MQKFLFMTPTQASENLSIKEDTYVVADCWPEYTPLKEGYPNLKQKLSNKGQNFKMLHIQIRKFKNWLISEHSYCKKEYLQKYIDEYFFRYNRRKHRASILDKIIHPCAAHLAPHLTYAMIRARALNG